MSQHHVHYVDLPVKVAVVGSVVKMTFAVDDPTQESDQPITTHTLVMPVGVYLDYVKGMIETFKDEGLRSTITASAEQILKRVKQ